MNHETAPVVPEFSEMTKQYVNQCNHITEFVTRQLDRLGYPCTGGEQETLAEQLAHDYWEHYPTRAQQFDELIDELCGDSANGDCDDKSKNVVVLRIRPSVVLETYIEWVIATNE